VNLDEFRRAFDELAGPESEPSAEARANVRQRSRRARQRRVAQAGAIVLVLAALVVATREVVSSSRRVQIGNGGEPSGVATTGGLFPDATGTTLILDDGASGIVAVDLDRRVAERRPTPGGGTQEQPIGIVGAGGAFFTGSNDIYAVPFDGSPSVLLGHANAFTRAAEPNDAWLVSWAGGRQGSGTPVSLREVDEHGKFVRQATNNDANLGFPEMGIPEGLAYETAAGVALWDAQTGRITSRLGTKVAFVDDVHADMLAWCEALCSTEHITRIGGRDISVSMPAGAAAFEGRSARFSPDGRYLAAVVGLQGPLAPHSSYEIDLLDTRTGVARVITTKSIPLGVSLAWSPDSQRLFFSPFAYANTHIVLGEYVLRTDQLHTATVPFWGNLGIAVAQSTAAPLLASPTIARDKCPPPVQARGSPTPTCAFQF
jgi:hypothetical protein